MKTTFLSLAAALLLALAIPPAHAATYTIDPTHSEIGFKVKHLMISTVRGEFTDYSGTFTFDPEHPEKASVEVEIKVASVDTGDEKRDEHLRSDDFFGVEEYPLMTFKSTSVEVVDEGEYKVHGDLTIRDVTRPVTLAVEFNGKVTDPWGNERAGFEAETEINRKNFNVNWSSTMDNGGLVVSDDVDIELEVEGVQKK